MPSLKVGSRGDDVLKIQKRLTVLGYDPGSQDGIFGAKTKEGVKMFQKANSIPTDGQVGPKTWNRLFPAVSSLSRDDKNDKTDISSVNLSSRNIKKLHTLHPIVRYQGLLFVTLCARQGITVLITQALRTYEEQDQLYAKGRTLEPIGPKYCVTNAKGGYSDHNFGFAFDVVSCDDKNNPLWDAKSKNWTIMGQIGKEPGLQWGGDWKTFVDRPHFYMDMGLSLAECRSLYAEGGLNNVWQNVSKH